MTGKNDPCEHTACKICLCQNITPDFIWATRSARALPHCAVMRGLEAKERLEKSSYVSITKTATTDKTIIYILPGGTAP